MARKPARRKDASLDDIGQAELDLYKRERELQEEAKRIVAERLERETMMPPMEEIQAREKQRELEYLVSRGEVANVLRAQNKSLFVLFLLIAATACMIWWGITLMHGK